MSYYGFAPYVSVGEKMRKADKMVEKLRKKDKNLAPVLMEDGVKSTWWGKAWNRNMENYADFDNRIGRGRSYVRNHMVLDLKIFAGRVEALVLGSASKPYQIEIRIDTLSEAQWARISSLCNRRIASLDQLIAGKFPRELEEIFEDQAYGLFPSPEEIHFSCSCPDYAYMCKHVAAVLYGIGIRLDQDPLLFFTLRSIDSQDLITKSIESKLESMLKNAGTKSERTIAEKDVAEIFGIGGDAF